MLSKTALPLKHFSRIRAYKTLVIIKNANLIAKLTVFFDSIRNFRVFPQYSALFFIFERILILKKYKQMELFQPGCCYGILFHPIHNQNQRYHVK